MTNNREEFKAQLIKTIEISNEYFQESKTYNQDVKDFNLQQKDYWIDRLNNEHFTLTDLKSVSTSILSIWRNSIGVDTELFWVELSNNNIEFERKDELNFALDKGRFRSVGVGMYARNEWHLIRKSNTIRKRFTAEEILKIDSIVEEDENKRFGILRKCLQKGEIPQTQYLKFGECMAYFKTCNLFSKYFTDEQVEKLFTIWGDFKSK